MGPRDPGPLEDQSVTLNSISPVLTHKDFPEASTEPWWRRLQCFPFLCVLTPRVTDTSSHLIFPQNVLSVGTLRTLCIYFTRKFHMSL